MEKEHRIGSPDVLIVGAGFAGMYALYKMREAGFSTVLLEAAAEVGGTWFHNRYPGLRCDVESLEYQYSWSQDLRNAWSWSERYPSQPEILSYAKWVLDRLNLHDAITFNAKVTTAVWNEDEKRWRVTTEDGRSWAPRFVVLATGALSVPRYPNIPGLETFKGNVFHTADWPQADIDLSGKRVGLIGTGSSGVQVATALASQVAQLSIFQRTAAYTIPARNQKLSEADHTQFRDAFDELDQKARAHGAGLMLDPPILSALDLSQETFERQLWERWHRGGAFQFSGAFTDIRLSEAANRRMADFVRARIRDAVNDPQTAERLCPSGHIGTRRICVDTGYYEIFNRETVALVDVSQDGIATFSDTGLTLESGAEHAFDVLILGTGYDAMTGAVLALDIHGVHSKNIQDAWADGPKSYLGLGVAGFPNLFTITGPGSPSVLTNVLRSIEHHVEWIEDCLTDLRARNATRIEVDAVAEENWGDHVREVAEATLFTKAASWYMGADIPGKPRVFMPYAGGLPRYRQICGKIAEDGYRGFHLA